MTPAERQRITDVFELAVRLPPGQRDAFLARECGSDRSLAEAVSALLSEHRSLRQTPAGDAGRAGDAPLPVTRSKLGKYQITGNLGAGGFGRVYQALDPSFGRVVAIKELNAPGDSEVVRRFRSEAKTLANLHHKNIVTVHEFFEEEGAPYLVMEFLDGTTLQALIERDALSLLEKVEIMLEVAEGLQYAHERGVIHRDIKPANIMRLADGAVKIMDFGIARIAAATSARLTQTGFLVGSLRYMAPEQFNGKSDALSDIFGYGVTFYELLTGQNPFSGNDPPAVMYQVLNTDTPPVRDRAAGCPEALERIVKRATARARQARYQSLSDILVDARPILLELRQEHAGSLYAEAERVFAAGQLEVARSISRKVLEMDPMHAGARNLRAQIDEALRRELQARALVLLETIERELIARQNDRAAGSMVALRQLGVDDAPLRVRMEMAESQLAQARHCEELLHTAREQLQVQRVTEAFRAVSEALASDPGSPTGKELLQEIQEKMHLRDAMRRRQEEIAHVERLLLLGETDQAVALLSGMEQRNPGHNTIRALREKAETQKAQEERSGRLAAGVARVRNYVRNSEFEKAVHESAELLSEFAGDKELRALHEYAGDRLVVKQRLEQVAALKSEASGLIEREEYDSAIRKLEAGVTELGDGGELARLLQDAIGGKAAAEQRRAVIRIEETAQLPAVARNEPVRTGEPAIPVRDEDSPPAAALPERPSAPKQPAPAPGPPRAGVLAFLTSPRAVRYYLFGILGAVLIVGMLVIFRPRPTPPPQGAAKGSATQNRAPIETPPLPPAPEPAVSSTKGATEVPAPKAPKTPRPKTVAQPQPQTQESPEEIRKKLEEIMKSSGKNQED